MDVEHKLMMNLAMVNNRPRNGKIIKQRMIEINRFNEIKRNEIKTSVWCLKN